MRAVAVFPDLRQVKLIERPEPRITSATHVKIRMLEVGVCGTDKTICAFRLGSPPPGSDHFVLGHESLGEISEVGEDVRDLHPGDLVVGSVRLPCPSQTCTPCRSGNQDFCATARYLEHGIQDLDGFMADYVIEDRAYVHRVPRSLGDVAVLIEPLTIAEKAIGEAMRVQQRLPWRQAPRHAPGRALVLGAGPVGLLGAMKLIREGFETYIYSLLPRPNPSARIAANIGATYLSSQLVGAGEMAEQVGAIDLVYEALGAAQIAFDVLGLLGPNGIYIFTGVPHRELLRQFDTERIVSNLVLKNQAIIGTVNAGHQAFADAIRDLEIFQSRWPEALRSIITARVPMEQFWSPVMGLAGGIKNVIKIADDENRR